MVPERNGERKINVFSAEKGITLDAYITCSDHMQPATDKFCPMCREKERIAREKEMNPKVMPYS
jgi:hypothetical protein